MTSNLYRILGLRPGADARRVKAAYRRLVKRFHPDAGARDRKADQRIREINVAYETLGHPEARAAYDLVLWRERAKVRGRYWRLMALGVATFILTASSVVIVTLHFLPAFQMRPQVAGEPKQIVLLRGSSSMSDVSAGPEIMDELRASDPAPAGGSAGKQMAAVAEPAPAAPAKDPPAREVVASLSVPEVAVESNGPASDGKAAPAPDKPAQWTAYRNARFGFALEYPSDVFIRANGDGDESLLLSKDGRATLWISGAVAPTADVAEFRQTLKAGRYADAAFDRESAEGEGFALSGSVGEERFFERVVFSCRHRTVSRWLLVYPAADSAYFAGIAEQIDRSYRATPAAHDGCDGAERQRLSRRRASD